MKKLRIHALACLLAALSLVGSVDGCFVLCIESDGRVSLERVADGCCKPGGVREQQRPDDTARTDRRRASTLDCSASKCADCTDVSIRTVAGGKLAPRKMELPRPKLPVERCVQIVTSSLSIDRGTGFELLARSNRNVALAHQRSIVLRC